MTTALSNSDGASVSPLLDQGMRRLFEQLPRTLVGDHEAVHHMRVAGRRLRVTLSILAPKPASRRVKRALAVLRELVQVAGRGRELDVCLELLKARLGALGPSSPERRLLRGRLAGAVRRSRKHLADAVLDLEIARLRRDLRFVAKGGSADALAVFARLRETWDGLGGAVVEGFGALGNRFDPEALHRLRRQARRLRYAAEVSRALTGHDSDAAAAFKDLQERLGAINDNYVLGDWLSKGAARARARGAAALAAEASSLAAWFDAQSRGHHRALLVRGPLQVATRALATMGRAPAESMRERTLARRRSRQEGPEHSASV